MIALDARPELTRTRRELARRRAALADLRPLHGAMGRAVLDWSERNFAAQGALEGGGGWPPLARTTLAARRRAGLGTVPLQATGRLRRGFALRFDARGATVTNAVPYAAAHQLGLGVPARPFLPGPAKAAAVALPAAVGRIREVLR